MVGWLLLEGSSLSQALLMDNGFHFGSLMSQSRRNGFVSLPRLINVNEFVSHLVGQVLFK